MPFWRLHYHLIWATRGREGLIGDDEAPAIVRSIEATCRGLGVVLHAVGVMPDHVHVAASVPPSIAVSTLVGRLKGASAHAVNAAPDRATDPKFAWQGEYGALSFGDKALPDVVAYVNNQRDRHANRQMIRALERDTDVQETQPA